MSARQILEELPELSRDERKQIANRALELNWDEAEREAMEFAEAASMQLAQFICHSEAMAKRGPTQSPTNWHLPHSKTNSSFGRAD